MMVQPTLAWVVEMVTMDSLLLVVVVVALEVAAVQAEVEVVVEAMIAIVTSVICVSSPFRYVID
jgi:hypothetical protein